MTEVQEKFIKLLKEMFQFDQADLDFGIYRIMNAKHDEIEKFLNEDLPNDINEGLKVLNNPASAEKIKELEDKIKLAIEMDMPKDKIDQLVAQKNSLTKSSDSSAAENEIYNNLLDFFSRYYDEGDFISQRRYSKGKYAIPYEGEEVKLHWANADQYYIKTSEYFKDYTFYDGFGNKVHFKILDAQTEQNNNESKDKKFFQLADCDKQFEIIDEELYIYVQYKAGTLKNQKAYNTVIIESFIQYIKDNIHEYQKFMTIIQKERGQETSKLEKELKRYTAKNTFDYFIHKDLRGFLTQELEFFIKNEVIRLDDIDETDEAKTKLILTKAKVLRNIAKKIIVFLAQLEDFQKKLFLKKKFVTETNYCITLDRIDESFYAEIAANDEQREEWKKLFAIDEIKTTGDDTFSSGKTAYSEPLTVEFLKENPYLVLDTAFFNEEFKEKLIASIDNLDEKLDGLLISSENFQALKLLQEKYKECVDISYTDPPYNTDSSPIMYKNNYRDSSWNSLIYDRLIAAKPLVKETGIFIQAIDDVEFRYLINVSDNVLGKENYISTISIECNPQGRVADNVNKVSDYHILHAKRKDKLSDISTEKLDNKSEMTPFKRTGTNSRREERPYRYYPILVKDNLITVIPENEYIKIYDRDSKLFDDNYVESLRNKYESLGYEFVLPLKEDGTKLVWQREYQRAVKECTTYIYKSGAIYTPGFEREVPKTLWKSPLYANPEYGTELLKHMMQNIVPHNLSDNTPKSIYTMKQFINILSGNLVLDYFAGSGTTAHAVIDFNRNCSIDEKIKYITCEMGEYFDLVTKPRLLKAIYAKEWKESKPIKREGTSHAFKYIRLESYEDTLNNISLKSVSGDFFESARKDYFLNYMMDFESKESDCLLNLDKFAHPFDYTMKITRKQECKEQKIDLVETFNYLIGLTVTSNGALQGYDAIFSTDSSKPLTATLKNNGSTYRIKMIEGTNRAAERVLVIWRDLTGDIEKDNAVLDAFFAKKHVNPLDFEYKTIYVNGDNNLQNVKTEDETWKVVLIDSEMKKRMFS